MTHLKHFNKIHGAISVHIIHDSYWATKGSYLTICSLKEKKTLLVLCDDESSLCCLFSALDLHEFIHLHVEKIVSALVHKVHLKKKEKKKRKQHNVV